MSQELNIHGVCVWSGIGYGSVIGPYIYFLKAILLAIMVIPQLQNSSLFHDNATQYLFIFF